MDSNQIEHLSRLLEEKAALLGMYHRIRGGLVETHIKDCSDGSWTKVHLPTASCVWRGLLAHYAERVNETIDLLVRHGLSDNDPACRKISIE